MRRSAGSLLLAIAMTLAVACGDGDVDVDVDADGLDGAATGTDLEASMDGALPLDLAAPPPDAASAPPDLASSPIDAAGPPPRPLDDLEVLFQRHYRPITSPSGYSEPASAGYHCLAAASGYRRALAGAGFDPAFRDQLLAGTRAAADFLVGSASRWGGAGWGLPNAWDAFQDGTTNPATTVYAFQTGLADWCLAEAAAVTGDDRYRALAQRSLAAYQQRGYVSSGGRYRVPCNSCGYFWYDLDARDAGRYVKNTSIEMAVAMLAYDRYFDDRPWRVVGAAATLSQYGEIKNRNYDYLGRLDARYVAGARAFDDHNSFEAYLLLRAAEMLRRSDFNATAIAHYQAYAPHGSAAYVAYAACHFARVLPAARTTCTAWVTANGLPSPAAAPGLVMDYR